MLVDRRDVAGAQPAGVELLIARGIVEVTRRDPGPAYLDLAGGLPVPGDLAAVVVDEPQLGPRQRLALQSAFVPVALVVPALLGGLAERHDGARLGHPPTLVDFHAVALLEVLYQLAGHGRAAADGVRQRGEIYLV